MCLRLKRVGCTQWKLRCRLVNKMTSYLEETKYWGPSNNAVVAVQIQNKYTKKALDLGCGSLRNSKYLFNSGFMVDAIDKDEKVREYTSFFKDRPKDAFKLIVDDYVKCNLGDEVYDIVIAQNTLSFNEKDEVEQVVSKIKRCLKVKGTFAGNFYSLEDYRVNSGGMSFYSEHEAKKLLSKVGKLLFFSKEEGQDENGNSKWTTYEFVVQKV